MSSLQALQAVQKARNWKIWIDFGHHECQFFHIQASPQLGECDGQKLKRILSGETEWTQQSLFCFKGPHEIPCHWKIIIDRVTWCNVQESRDRMNLGAQDPVGFQHVSRGTWWNNFPEHHNQMSSGGGAAAAEVQSHELQSTSLF